MQAYNEKGVLKPYSWQHECLEMEGVLEGGNLIYSAPTSAGKTFVSEILMLRTVLAPGKAKKTIFVVPFVSIVTEKVEYFQKLLDQVVPTLSVQGFYSKIGGNPSMHDILICTIEKGNSLINHFIDEKRMHEIGIVVVDELHMVGDASRGYLLELMLSKLLYINSVYRNRGLEPVQIVGMSATMSNTALLSQWLKAAFYQTDYRPVSLEEYIVLKDNDSKKKNNHHQHLSVYRYQPESRTFASDRKIQPLPHVGFKIPDEWYLCQDIFLEPKLSMLVFCASRARVETTCIALCDCYERLNFATAAPVPPALRQHRHDLLEQLSRVPTQLDPTLGRSVPHGIAFHHAGLTVDERTLIEDGFRRGWLHVLVCTTTLGAGVNLPCRRVVFMGLQKGREQLSPGDYRQMRGRAGRTGLDDHGESYVLVEKKKAAAKNSDQEELEALKTGLVDSVPQSLRSGLRERGLGSGLIDRCLLEAIYCDIARSDAELQHYFDLTLCALTARLEEEQVKKAGQIPVNYSAVIEGSIASLYKRELIVLTAGGVRQAGENHIYSISSLGAAIVAAGLEPDDGLFLFRELSLAQENFCFKGDLHIVYCITPIRHAVELNSQSAWARFEAKYLQLSKTNASTGFLSVAERCGIEAGDIYAGKMGFGRRLAEMSRRRYARFWAAILLRDIINEVPLTEIVGYSQVARGNLQSLQESAATFSGAVSIFLSKLNWTSMERAFADFHDRLNFGVRHDILQLVQIPHVKAARARALYNEGFRTVEDVALGRTADIVKALKSLCSYTTVGKSAQELEKINSTLAVKVKKGAARVVLNRKKLLLQEAEEAVYLLDSDVRDRYVPNEGKMETLTTSNCTVAKLCESRQMDMSVVHLPQLPVPHLGTPTVNSSFSEAPKTPTMLHRMPLSEISISLTERGNIPSSGGEKVLGRKRKQPGEEKDKEGEGERERERDKGKSVSMHTRPPLRESKATVVRAENMTVLFEDQNLQLPSDNVRVESIGMDATSEAILDALKCDAPLVVALSSAMLSSTAADWSALPMLQVFVYCEGATVYVLECHSPCEPEEIGRWKNRLASILSHAPQPKIMVDASVQRLKLHQLGLSLSGTWWDPRVAWWLLNPEMKESSVSVETMCELTGVSNLSVLVAPFRKQHRSSLHNEGLIQSILCASLMRCLRKRLELSQLWDVYSQLEVPISAILMEMTLVGVPFQASGYCPPSSAVMPTDLSKLDTANQQFKTMQSCAVAIRVDQDQDQEEKFRIHARFLQTVSATGRVEVISPELQHLVKQIRFCSGDMVSPRSCIATGAGRTLMSADYKNLEMSLLGHFSQDLRLLEALATKEGDFFHALSTSWLHIAHPTKDDRQRVKKIIYAMIYGQSLSEMAKQMEVSQEEAERYRCSFWEHFHQLKQFLDGVKEKAINQGFVTTLLGRKRPIVGGGHSPGKGKRGWTQQHQHQCERIAVNTLCQGSAADLVKMAMIKLYKGLERISVHHALSVETRPWLVLQVHDELLVDTPYVVLDAVHRCMRKSMEDVFEGLGVKLQVRVHVGEDWGHMRAL